MKAGSHIIVSSISVGSGPWACGGTEDQQWKQAHEQKWQVMWEASLLAFEQREAVTVHWEGKKYWICPSNIIKEVLARGDREEG